LSYSYSYASPSPSANYIVESSGNLGGAMAAMIRSVIPAAPVASSTLSDCGYGREVRTGNPPALAV